MIYIPDPANYTMKANKPKPVEDSPAEGLTVDPTDVGAVRAMAWDKLVRIAAVAPPNASLLPILRELMDRIEGKPRQQIDTTLKGEMTTTIQIVRFSDIPQHVVIDGDSVAQKLITD